METIKKNFFLLRLIICCISDETHHNSTLIFAERSQTHTVNNIVNLVEKCICRKENQYRKVITIASDNGKNMVKAMSDLVIMDIMIFVLTLQFYVQGIIIAHSRETELKLSIIRKIVS